MMPQAERVLSAILREMFVERQGLPSRKADYLRALAGLPSVRLEQERDLEAVGKPNGAQAPVRCAIACLHDRTPPRRGWTDSHVSSRHLASAADRSCQLRACCWRGAR